MTEDDAQLDSVRSRIALLLIQLNSSFLISQTVTTETRGADILRCLSTHFLSVTAVTQSITSSIAMVVDRLSSVMLADLAKSTISENAEALLIVLTDYFQWLRSHRVDHIKLCRKEEIIHSVDSSLRAWLKAESYHSAAALVRAYRQKYKSQLTNMPIPFHPFTSADVIQAHKDLSRESIRINRIGFVFDSIRNIYTILDNKCAPISTSISSEGGNINLGSVGNNKTFKYETVIRDELRKVLTFLFDLDFNEQTAARSSSVDINEQTAARSFSADSRLQMLPPPICLDRRQKETEVQVDPPMSGTSSRNTANRNTDPAALLELLVLYVMLGASRTFAAGDAFFILSDLYGGDGLTLCPFSSAAASALPAERTISSSFMPSSSGDSSPPIGITVDITLTGVKIMMSDRYRLFSSDELHRCIDPKSLSPLMHFECTTTTLIAFPQRAKNCMLSMSGNTMRSNDKVESEGACSKLLHTLTQSPMEVCARAVSICPYI